MLWLIYVSLTGLRYVHIVGKILFEWCQWGLFWEEIVVQLLSCVWLFVAPWTAAHVPGFPVLYHLLELTQSHACWVSDAIQPSHPVVPVSSCLQSFPASGLSNESALHTRWSKYWSLSFRISTSNEYSGLISFRMDWFDVLAVQGTLKSLLQYHSSKAPILQCSALFMVQLLQPHTTTEKHITLTSVCNSAFCG